MIIELKEPKYMNHKILKFISLIFMFWIVGCGSDGNQYSKISFSRIDCPSVAANSAYSEPINYILSDQHAYRERYLSTNLDADREPPGINFNTRSEEHTSELQSRPHLVCRLLLEKKNKTKRK